MTSRRLLLSPIVVFVLACVVSATTYAAYTARTAADGQSLTAGSVSLHDNDSGGAMLSLSNAGLGDSDTSCIRVGSSGTLPSDVRLMASSTGALAPYLNVRITRGTGAAAFDDCTGFSADPRDYYGLGMGVVYDGRLSDLPSSWASGVRDPSTLDYATAIAPLMAAGSGLEGLWEVGELTRGVDDFRATAGTTLGSHQDLTGASWSQQGESTADAAITAAGRVRIAAPGTSIYRLNIATTGVQAITADVTPRSATGEAGILTRMETSGDSGYLTRYVAATGTWELGVLNAGSFTALDSYTGAIPIDGTAHVSVTSNGTSTSVQIDGVQRLTASDGTFPMSTYAGVRFSDSAWPTDYSGVQLDNFRVWSGSTNAAAATVGLNGGLLGWPNAPVVAGEEPSPTEPHSGATFDGSSQAMSLPVPALDTAATIAGWFKLQSGDVTLRDATSGATDGWSLGFDDGSGTLKFRSSGEVFDTGVPFGALRSAWHHHALVRDGANVSYYLDGRQVFTGTAAASTAVASPLYVMRDGTGSTYSAGSVDHLAAWSRALSADELAAIHDGISAPALWHAGDEHWYRIRVSVAEDVNAGSKTADANFVWEAHNR